MYTPVRAEILTIGDEVTRGEIINTNTAWLAERLTGQGLDVRWHTSVRDEPGDISAALGRAGERADLLLVTGGLGPTDDDRTVDVVAQRVGAKAVIEAEHLARMEERFRRRGLPSPPNNYRQVRIVEGAFVLPNRAGLAPGFRLRIGRADAYFLPGVPREMKQIFTEEIVPRLPGSEVVTARRVWRVTGMAEAMVDHRLEGLIEGIADATLHFRIAFPEILVTVVVRRATQTEADAVLDGLDHEVRRRLGEAVYGSGDATFPAVIGARLRTRGETLAVAESCTGGLIGDLITDVPGSSDYFLGGVLVYSNALKQSLLGVHAETLVSHGAVSEPCVREMAEGVRRVVGANWGLAVSGVAGPGGGSVEKPVGRVHLAVASANETRSHKIDWPSERRLLKQVAAYAALELLWRQVRA